MTRCELVVTPRTVARWSAVAIALLVMAHSASQLLRFGFGRDYQMGLARELYLGSEAAIPNWFSSVLILACAAALLTIARVRRGERYHGHWLALGIVFVLMSLDESAALHDLSAPLFYGVIVRLAHTIGGPFVALANKPNYAWMVPGIAFCALVAVAYVPFLASLPLRTRAWFIGSGIVYVAGAVGFEAIEGWYSGTWGSKNPGFVALLTCEETLEMVGMSLFLYALVRYLDEYAGTITICFSSRHPPASGLNMAAAH
jgi:hypothetical protein